MKVEKIDYTRYKVINIVDKNKTIFKIQKGKKRDIFSYLDSRIYFRDEINAIKKSINLYEEHKNELNTYKNYVVVKEYCKKMKRTCDKVLYKEYVFSANKNLILI